MGGLDESSRGIIPGALSVGAVGWDSCSSAGEVEGGGILVVGGQTVGSAPPSRLLPRRPCRCQRGKGGQAGSAFKDGGEAR